jgi:hypothetical protein
MGLHARSILAVAELNVLTALLKAIIYTVNPENPDIKNIRPSFT